MSEETKPEAVVPPQKHVVPGPYRFVQMVRANGVSSDDFALQIQNVINTFANARFALQQMIVPESGSFRFTALFVYAPSEEEMRAVQQQQENADGSSESSTQVPVEA